MARGSSQARDQTHTTAATGWCWILNQLSHKGTSGIYTFNKYLTHTPWYILANILYDSLSVTLWNNGIVHFYSWQIQANFSWEVTTSIYSPPTGYDSVCFHYTFFNFWNWSIVDLQCCANFCCTAKWPNHIYIYIYIYIYSLFYVIFPGLSQETRYISLCYRVRPHSLSTLNVIVCIYEPQAPIALPRPPPWQSQVCSLSLWVCFFFIDKFM